MENLTVKKQVVLDLCDRIRKSSSDIADQIAAVFMPRPIGVWCLSTNGDMVKPDEWRSEHQAQGVLVVTEKDSFVIAPCATTVHQFGAMGRAKSSLMRDVKSMDSKATTDAIIAAYKNTHYTDDDGRIWDVDGSPAADYCRQYSHGNIKEWDLPTVEQLLLMHQYRDEINDCLKAMGGYKLTATGHWSSIEKDGTFALVVFMLYGNVNDSNKFYDFSVRPVSAFPL